MDDRNYQALQIMFDFLQISLTEWQRIIIEKLKWELACRAEEISELYAELRFYRDMLDFDSEPLELVDLAPMS